jgi:hypothetical protein
VKAPKYDDQYGIPVECSICGCLTTNPDKHSSFHEGLARLLRIEDVD